MDETREPSTPRKDGQRQEAVATLGRRALEVDSLDQLLAATLPEIVEALDAEYASVLERDGDGTLRRRRRVGWPAGPGNEGRVPTDADSLAGRALHSGAVVLVDDFEKNEQIAELGRDLDGGPRSGLAVSIGSGEEPWGVLEAYDDARGAFTEPDAFFLQNVADVLATAIERRFSTDQRSAHQPEERYCAFLESIDRGVCILKLLFDDGVPVDCTIVETNRAFEGYTGFENAEGRTVGEFDAGVERYWSGQYGRGARTREPERFEEIVDAWDAWFDGYAFPIGDPTENYVAVLFDDVTERNRREWELELFRNLLDHSTDSVFVADPETGRILDVNATARQRTGYSREELLDLAVPDLEQEIRDREAWRAVVEHVETGQLETFDGVRRCKDGTTFPVEVNLSYVELDRAYVLAMVRDVTERRKREHRLAKSNERLEQFAYAASHDLQEPLRMVSSYLQLLERRYGDDLDADAGEFLAYAVDGADRMRAMIDGLLEYSRIESGGEPLEPVKLEPLLWRVLDNLQLRIEERNAEIVVAGTLPRVQGDSTQLRQLFQNVLDNAIEYGGDSPRVRTAERDSSMWRLSVRDDGIGIAREDRERVFDIFQRLHTRDEHAGTGIGLALCKRIVERHGGEIWIGGRSDEETEISFTLPAVTDAE